MKWMRVFDDLLLNLDYVQEIFVSLDATDEDGNSLGPTVLARIHGEEERTIILGKFETLAQAKAFLGSMNGLPTVSKYSEGNKIG